MTASRRLKERRRTPGVPHSRAESWAGSAVGEGADLRAGAGEGHSPCLPRTSWSDPRGATEKHQLDLAPRMPKSGRPVQMEA
jgi:hypothetical protein